MKIVIPGGTGQVGAILQRAFVAAGHEVVLLTRRPNGPDQLAWDGRTLGPWAAEIDGCDVVVNLAAPNPLPQRDFTRVLRRTWRMPLALPATKSMAELGAWLIRSDTELLLKSRRVVPGRLLDAGFDFGFATWPEASADLIARVTASRARGSSRTAAESAA